MLHLAATVAAPDMGWLSAIVDRVVLAGQIAVTIVLAGIVLKDIVIATAGGKGARTAAKEALGERVVWFVGVWAITPAVALIKWMAGAA